MTVDVGAASRARAAGGRDFDQRLDPPRAAVTAAQLQACALIWPRCRRDVVATAWSVAAAVDQATGRCHDDAPARWPKRGGA